MREVRLGTMLPGFDTCMVSVELVGALDLSGAVLVTPWDVFWSGFGGPLGRLGRSKLFTSSFVPGALTFKALYAVFRTGSLRVQSFPRHRS